MIIQISGQAYRICGDGSGGSSDGISVVVVVVLLVFGGDGGYTVPYILDLDVTQLPLQYFVIILILKTGKVGTPILLFREHVYGVWLGPLRGHLGTIGAGPLRE